MKKVVFLMAVIYLFGACKKKKEAEPEPTPEPVTYSISVKVNGTEKHCNGCYSGSKSGGSRSSYFYLAGFDEQIYFSSDKYPTVGTYNLVKYGDPYLIYVKNNTYYRASVGAMTINAIDTSSGGVVRKLTATFNFKTDTTGGVFFNVTEGSINLK